MRQTLFGLAALLVAGATVSAGDEPAETPPTFSEAAPAVCGAGGLNVTVALVYQANVVGPIAASYVDLRVDLPLALPSEAKELRSRFTSHLPPSVKTRPIREAKRLRVALTTTEQGIQPAKAFTIRFDCPAGSRIAPSAFSCATDEVVSATGQPLDEALATQTRCLVVGLDPAHR